MINFNTVFNSEFVNFIPELSNDEISPQLSKILNVIHMEGKTTSSKLSRILNIPISNMSRSINTLNSLEYIVKKQDSKDKRIVYLTLSSKALDYISKVIASSQEVFWERLNIFSEDEIEELTSSFLKIQNLFIKMREANNSNQRNK
ncbi:winged helix DNA-binding protein [Clostridium sp. 19966]|nr:winged helix DNA-binding protein [Clostridium sp. 19966]